MKVIHRACSPETVARRFSWKKLFLKIFKNSQENTCGRVSFLIKKTLAQVFSCEFREISKKTFFKEHHQWLLLQNLYQHWDWIIYLTNCCYHHHIGAFCLLNLIGDEDDRSSHHRCSVKKVFYKGKQRQNPLAQVFSCEFGKIFKNTFFCRTSPVTASGMRIIGIIRYRYWILIST